MATQKACKPTILSSMALSMSSTANAAASVPSRARAEPRKSQKATPAAAPAVSRRQLGGQLFSAAAAAALALQRPPAAAAADTGGKSAAALTPYQRGLALEYGLKEGRIQTCPSDANPNCVSTSATNATYMPAWEAPPGSAPSEAILRFEAALKEVAPSARLVASASEPGASEYRRYAVDDPLFDHDDIEVLIALQRAPYESEPPLVTFRSMAAEVKYIWPIQQAVTDFGAQRQRLKEVRQRLGWRILGCDLLECFEE